MKCSKCGTRNLYCFEIIDGQNIFKCLSCGNKLSRNELLPDNNGDRFRDKTNEELAECFSRNFSCYQCPAGNDNCQMPLPGSKKFNGCRDAWLDWLNKEAKP